MPTWFEYYLYEEKRTQTYRLAVEDVETEFSAEWFFKEEECRDGLWGEFNLNNSEGLKKLKEVYDQLVSIQLVNS
jgi:hypothetical protein